MARRFKRGLEAPIRGVVRQGIREGKTRTEIFEHVQDRYGIGATRKLVDMVRQEERRQNAVATITARDKRRNVDLGREVGCTDAANRVRAYITLHWQDPDTGFTYSKGNVVELDKTGRLADILNKAIGEITAFYLNKRYDVPKITSANQTGRAYYRLEYVECV